MHTLDDIIVDFTPPIPKQCLNTYQDELDGYKNQDNSLESLPWLLVKEEKEESKEVR